MNLVFFLGMKQFLVFRFFGMKQFLVFEVLEMRVHGRNSLFELNE